MHRAEADYLLVVARRHVTNKVAAACTTRVDAYAYPRNNAITKMARLRLLGRA